MVVRHRKVAAAHVVQFDGAGGKILRHAVVAYRHAAATVQPQRRLLPQEGFIVEGRLEAVPLETEVLDRTGKEYGRIEALERIVTDGDITEILGADGRVWTE